MRRSITATYFHSPMGRTSEGVLPVNAAALKYRYSAHDVPPAYTSVGCVFWVTKGAVFEDKGDISEDPKDSTFAIPLNNP